MGRFSEQDFQFAPAWRPEAGDILEGKVTEVTSRVTDYGEYPIVTLDTEEGRTKDNEMISGEIAVHGVHTSLRNQIADGKPQPGDYVGVWFQGLVRRNDADDFYGYRMKIDRVARMAPAVFDDKLSFDESSADDSDDVPF
jgi:hypothetical protein